MTAHRNMNARQIRSSVGRPTSKQLIVGLAALLGATTWAGTAQALGPGEGSRPETVKTAACRTSDFLAGTSRASAQGVVTLQLAAGCSYALSMTDSTTNGVLAITGSLTVDGNGASIVGPSPSDSAGCSRIFDVAAGGSLTLIDVTVEGGNTACPPTGASGLGTNDGAGILIQPGGSARLERTVVTNNKSGGNGGGIANFGTTTLVDSTVSNNTAHRNGGGIYQGAGQLNVLNSRIDGNAARKGVGGGVAAEGGQTVVSGSTIHANSAGSDGGGVAASGTSTTVRVESTNLTGNTADGTGGGINNRQVGSFSFHDGTVSRNKAGGNGGGIHSADSPMLIERSRISANVTTGDGGGVATEAAANLATNVAVYDSTVSSNLAVGPSSRGGGIYNHGTRLLLRKDLVMFNISRLPAGGVDNARGRVVLEDTSIFINSPTNCRGVPFCS
ncbi:hypothetical protein Vwe01_63870 [Micromonospora andamanensis]|nr:hypothetical protein Vwe01_63870 [Micromonospora andamanensis]